MTALPHAVHLLRRWLWRGLLTVALFELTYVLAFEWAARSGHLAQWINRRPEKFVISFAEAHSYLPFWIRASALELHGQTPRQRWRLLADRVGGWISPLDLLRRTVRISQADAEGGEFWLRAEPISPDSAEAAQVATSPDSRLPPLAALAPSPRPHPNSSRPKWSFELPQIKLHGFREVWLGQLRMAGEIGAEGSVAIYSGRELEVGPSRIDLSGVLASIGDAAVGRDLTGVADIRIARYPFKEQRGLAAIPFISAEVDLRGDLAERELLNLFLKRAPWLSFGSSQGAFRAHIALEGGQFLRGTRVEFEHPNFETSIFDFRASGDASVLFEVAPAEGAARGAAAGLTVRYDDFSLRSAGEARPQISGTGFSLVATAAGLDLESVTKGARVRIDLGRARIVDLASYNSWIPESSGLHLVKGSGAISGRFEADLEANRAEGEFHAAIDDASVRYRDLDLEGSVQVDVRIPEGDLERRVLELSGTRFDLRGFGTRRAEATSPAVGTVSDPGWWARIELAGAHLMLPPAAAAGGRFTVRLRDSVPVVGLFTSRKSLPRWVERLLSIEDVEASGRFEWSPSETLLDEFETKIRKASVRARMRFTREVRRGLLMVEWHRLAVGLRLDNERKQWKFVGVRPWFESGDLGGAKGLEPGDDPLSEPGLSHAEWNAPKTYDGVELPTVGFDFEVVPGSAVRGELDGDADPEAVALVALPSLADPKVLRLAAVDLVEGRAEPLAALELPAGVEVRSLAVVAGAAVAEWIVPKGMASGGPSFHKESLRWRPTDGSGRTERLAAGRLDLKDLAGRRWQADRSSLERSRGELPAFSLSFSEEGVEVDWGCQRFASRATLGEDLVLRFGAPTAVTALTGNCTEPASRQGDGAADASPGSEGVYRLEFRPGQLRLVPIEASSGPALPPTWLRLVAP